MAFAPAEVKAAVAQWIDAKNLDFVETDQLQWLDSEMVGSATDRSHRMKIQWTGFIEAPRSGKYTFSICPVNVHAFSNSIVTHENWSVRSSTTVWIDGQQVLHSTADEWKPEGDAVSLQADTKRAIRVELLYEHTRGDVCPGRPPVAILYWEGPGLEREIVPTSALFVTENGTDHGLRGEYEATTGENTLTRSRVDPNLDMAWVRRGSFLATNRGQLARLAAQLNARYTDPGYLSDAAEAVEEGQQLLPDARRGAQSMSSAERAVFLRQTTQQNDLMQSLSFRQARRLYTSFRYGAVDEALEFLGQWMQLHPDAAPTFAGDFFWANRSGYTELMIALAWEYPPHLEKLQEDFLEMPDGGCCLPAAYTLSYGHMARGTFDEWLDLLDAQLDDEAMRGDRRVNWLLARAQAEEIRQSQGGRNWPTLERMLSGWGWLDEASLVAQTEAVGLRVSKEKATRRAAHGHWDRLDQVLDRAAKKHTSTAAQAALAQWRTEIEKIAKIFEERDRRIATRSQEAYINTLTRRLKTAAQRGDAQAVARYETIIATAKEELKQMRDEG